MVKGILHTHLMTVVVFLLFFLFKYVLLITRKEDLLDQIRSKTKIFDIVLGVLLLLTGGYLLTVVPEIEPWLWAKTLLVFLLVPLGIVGMKKHSKVLSTAALFLLLYVYGMAETRSLTFKRAPIAIDYAAAGQIEKGQAVYQQVCQNCHGTDGQAGIGGAKNLAESKLGPDERLKLIGRGKGLMPGYGKTLQPDEIEAVSAFVAGFVK